MKTSLTRSSGGVPSLFEEFRREMDHTLNQFFSRDLFGDGSGENGGWFSPRVNVSETDDEYEISVDLPGLKPEDFNIELRNGDLWITGERKEDREDEHRNWHRIECRHGQFRRVIPLGQDVDPAKVNAEYHDGVLKVTVPRSETARPQRIPVKG